MKTYITQQNSRFRSIRNSNGTTTIECLIVANLNIKKLQQRFPFIHIEALCHSIKKSYSIFSIHRGYATCSPNDKFNKSKGRHLAESRAKAAMYKYYAKMLNTMRVKIKASCSSVVTIILKNLSCNMHEIQHVYQLSK